MYNDEKNEMDLTIDDYEEEEELELEESSVVDKDVKYIAELMQRAINLCKEVHESCCTIVEVNDIFKEAGIGFEGIDELIATIDNFYNDFLPDLILSKNEEDIIKSVKKSFGMSSEIAEAYVEEKRENVLNKMEELKKDN